MNDYILINGELCHWGVLGMKWGVRRNRNSSDQSNSRNRKGDDDYEDRRSADQQRMDHIKRKSLSEMSNDELRFLTQREELERKYNSARPSTVNKGLSFVKKTVDVGTTLVNLYNMANNVGKIVSGDDKWSLRSKFVKK